MKKASKRRLCTAALLGAGALSLVATSVARAAVLPYSADANTIYLYHLNEAAGGSLAANSGSAGFGARSFDGNLYAGDGVPQPNVTTVLGAAGFAGFGNAADMTGGVAGTTDLGLGVDANGDGNIQLDDNAPISADRLADHSSIFGVSSAFTLEAMVRVPSITSGNREIIATDNAATANGDRGFQFRINGTGNLEFNFIGTPTIAALLTLIPTTGDHAFVANEWFHTAFVFDGTNGQFYWTRVSPTFTSANPVGAAAADSVEVGDDMFLIIGNEARVVGTTGSTEGLGGQIDEVRISNVARTAGQFIFVPEPAAGALALAGLALAAVRRRRAA